ncbi:uncharacterized protein L969DRAFT_93998 [Mixia osmundae IAM 14324]|uniref:Uncharacterized protein n=1 Tax=Mixia osmundae (strain CBS 9802 / IAM 14324 / JCM 22182 / KY 12970) TaxID=764103 RepID=G7E8S2_MIXOS|nr:uncharacterized protein L969DRAFT_93998 [Mixia osmundae IAM 14324]KEI40176.1 hypothetical protein L969DRAFT_93998 [Mixia osmundae IAM 14324]GAA99540.1 hypothetical protein E5Q_06241 [Mixia osmundae IAM 14324]
MDALSRRLKQIEGDLSFQQRGIPALDELTISRPVTPEESVPGRSLPSLAAELPIKHSKASQKRYCGAICKLHKTSDPPEELVRLHEQLSERDATVDELIRGRACCEEPHADGQENGHATRQSQNHAADPISPVSIRHTASPPQSSYSPSQLLASSSHTPIERPLVVHDQLCSSGKSLSPSKRIRPEPDRVTRSQRWKSMPRATSPDPSPYLLTIPADVLLWTRAEAERSSRTFGEGPRRANKGYIGWLETIFWLVTPLGKLAVG